MSNGYMHQVSNNGGGVEVEEGMVVRGRVEGWWGWKGGKG